MKMHIKLEEDEVVQSITVKIVAVRPLTASVREIRLAPIGEASLPSFEAGAHIRISLPDGDTRAYSLIEFAAIPEAPDHYQIAVQLEADSKGGSAFMHGLSVGDEIAISAPKNDFPLVGYTPVMLLAGGIGVTPMISMAATLVAAGRNFEFHYAARNADVIAYRDELTGVCGDALHVHFDDDPATALKLDKLLGQITEEQHLYVCGPRGMIDAAKAIAEAAGIDAQRVHFELFDTPAQAEGDAPFEVELSSSGEVFTVQPGQTIIEVLEEGGVDVMYDCQRGDCGICRCDVISGTPDHRDVVLSESERAAGNVMQICVSRSKSPRLVLDL
ncbi:MAG: PDR/VanB family oxidoreductase [Roseovarius sp.]